MVVLTLHYAFSICLLNCFYNMNGFTKVIRRQLCAILSNKTNF